MSCSSTLQRLNRLRRWPLIERTEAIGPLQPIVVALRRELGQNPSVSRELDEVSKDVQQSIMQMRKGLDTDRVSMAAARDRLKKSNPILSGSGGPLGESSLAFCALRLEPSLQWLWRSIIRLLAG